MLEGIRETFEKSLEINVNTWSPMKQLKLAKNISQEELDKFSLKLGVALGLALYQYD